MCENAVFLSNLLHEYVQVFRLALVSVFCDVTERVSVRGFGGQKRQRKNTGKIFHISAHTKSNPTEWGGVKPSFYLKDVGRESFCWVRNETSYTESSAHAEFKTWLKMVPYGACFYFIGLFYCKALTIKGEKVCKKMMFRGNSYKMPKVKNYFFGYIYRYSKIKKGDAAFFFQIKRV